MSKSLQETILTSKKWKTGLLQVAARPCHKACAAFCWSHQAPQEENSKLYNMKLCTYWAYNPGAGSHLIQLSFSKTHLVHSSNQKFCFLFLSPPYITAHCQAISPIMASKTHLLLGDHYRNVSSQADIFVTKAHLESFFPNEAINVVRNICISLKNCVTKIYVQSISRNKSKQQIWAL